jgi:single-strand DNA-binding protein
MDGVNKVILLGNLGAEPELSGSGDSSRLSLRIATDESYKDKTGERKTRTEWHRVTVWGRRAEGLAKAHLSKGDRIYVEGRITTRSYEKDGQKRYSTEVTAVSVLLNGKRGGSGSTYGEDVKAEREPGDDSDLDGDAPF